MKQSDKWRNFDVNCYTYINCYLKLGLCKDIYTYRDTNHSDMEEVCMERTELAHIQDFIQ
jgi:hypothetical protein